MTILWLVAIVVLVFLAVLLATHIKEELQIRKERKENKRIKEAERRGEPISMAIFDEKANEIDRSDFDPRNQVKAINDSSNEYPENSF